jgi:hypothetical protein
MFNVEKIIGSVKLRDLVTRAGSSIDNHGRGVCPLHGGDNTSAFSIYYKDGKEYWFCYTGDCGGGDAITFVQKWQGVGFKEACAFLGGDVISDPAAMLASAQAREQQARIEAEAANAKHEARLTELQAEHKHTLYHDTMKQWGKDLWTGRGLDEGLQDFFTLGACDSFMLNTEYRTTTLTIPIFSEERDLLNIKHRLVNPIKANDKYRPETSGLGAFPPLLAIPEMGYDGDLIIVVEGEIKAMVTWARLDISDYQVIGVPGKDSFKRIADRLTGKKVLVIPDPQGEKEAFELARKVQGRILEVPNKIDDFLIETNMTSDNFYSLIRQARKVNK